MTKPKQASWRTLMRKASKAATPAIASKLRTQAAKLRREERARSGPIADERVRELADKRLESEQVPRESLEAELARRDQQLIDEFISKIANLRRFGPQPGCDPNHYLVPNSTIDAILKVLTRK